VGAEEEGVTVAMTITRHARACPGIHVL